MLRVAFACCQKSAGGDSGGKTRGVFSCLFKTTTARGALHGVVIHIVRDGSWDVVTWCNMTILLHCMTRCLMFSLEGKGHLMKLLRHISLPSFSQHSETILTWSVATADCREELLDPVQSNTHMCVWVYVWVLVWVWVCLGVGMGGCVGADGVCVLCVCFHCDLQARKINFTNSKTLVGRCRDRP